MGIVEGHAGRAGYKDLVRLAGTPDFYTHFFNCLASELPEAKAVLLYFYDEGKNSMYLKNAFGFERKFEGMRLPPALEGVYGKISVSGKSEVISDSYHLKKFIEEMAPLAEIVRFDDGLYYEPSSLIVCPVMRGGEADGLMVVIDHALYAPAAPDDVALAEKFAGMVSMHRQLKNANAENAVLQQEILHLTSCLSRSGDAARYASVAGSMFGALFQKGLEFGEMLEFAYSHTSFPMTLYNIFFEVLAQAGEGAPSALPDNIAEFVRGGGLSKKTWFSVEYEGGFLFLTQIRHGGTAYGLLAFRSRLRTIPEKERILIDTLITFLSFVWLKKVAVGEYNKNLKNEILTTILSGEKDASLVSKLDTVGLAKSGKYFVLLIVAPEAENHMDYCERQSGINMLGTIERAVTSLALKCAVVPEYNDVCVIVSCGETKVSAHRYSNIVDKLIGAITAERGDLTVSGSRLYDAPYSIRKCYWEASQCLRIIKKYFIHRKSFNYIDMGALRLLLAQNPEDIGAYLEDILAPIIEYDKTRGTDLLMTLFYYSRFNKSVGYVSKKLNIHPNTLYQRIKKIEELLGYGMDDPMDWFDIQAASIMYGLIYTNFITNL